MWIIVGLGNPGKKYERSRHNAGFDALILLADRLKIGLHRARCRAVVGEGRIGDEKIVLALPQTYMNLSGQSVAELLSYYKATPERLLIVYDDVDLPLGKLRLRPRGSAGTHNGMRNIVYTLENDEFARLRIGVDKPPEKWDMADYVLSGYATADERKTAFDAYVRAGEVIERFILNGYESAAAFANL